MNPKVKVSGGVAIIFGALLHGCQKSNDAQCWKHDFFEFLPMNLSSKFQVLHEVHSKRQMWILRLLVNLINFIILLQVCKLPNNFIQINCSIFSIKFSNLHSWGPGTGSYFEGSLRRNWHWGHVLSIFIVSVRKWRV